MTGVARAAADLRAPAQASQLRVLFDMRRHLPQVRARYSGQHHDSNKALSRPCLPHGPPAFALRTFEKRLFHRDWIVILHGIKQQ